MPRTYWNTTDLARHIEAHNRARAAEFTVSVSVGTLSADFEIPVWVPPNPSIQFERAYLVASAAHGPSAAAHWDISLDQRIDGRDRNVGTLSTSRRSLGAMEAAKLSGSAVTLEGEAPLVLSGTKTGSPAALDNLLVVIVCSLG